MVAYLQWKHQGVHLHGLDMRDTYTNSIINDNVGAIKAQNESYQMTYAVKTVENLFHGVHQDHPLPKKLLNRWHVFECLCVQRIFQLPEMAKNEVADFSGQICVNNVQ